MKVSKNLLLVIGFSSLFFFSCSNNNDDKGSGMTKFNVYLTDAPGDYEEVLIDIREVRVHVDNADSTDEGGWQTLENINEGVYNLLDFTNNMDTLLASDELPAGHISQMRLILGDNNQVKIDGVYHDLKTPSGQQSGLKLNIHADLEEDIEYDIWIDFDADKSIVKAGNSGIYILKPVIRTYTRATSGAIEGTVNPVGSRPYVMAVSSAHDTIGTPADTITGAFMLKGLTEGDYTVVFEPVTGYVKKTMEDVSVTFGVVTDLGTIEIEEE